MKRPTAKLLHDALSASREIEGYVAEASYEQLQSDRSLQLILERLYEIVGEALNQAEESDPTLRRRVPEVGDIIGMRNRIAHGYWEISYKILWDTAIGKVPALSVRLERFLEEEPID